MLGEDMSSETITVRRLYGLESARLPTAFGEFTITVYRDGKGQEHLAAIQAEAQAIVSAALAAAGV